MPRMKANRREMNRLRRRAVRVRTSSSSSRSSCSSRGRWWRDLVGVGVVDLDVSPRLNELPQGESLSARHPQ
jgi:hypothetical protein